MEIFEVCRNCTLGGRIFFRIMWYGMMAAPELLCKASVTEISQFAMITDVVCNHTFCIDVQQ